MIETGDHLDFEDSIQFHLYILKDGEDYITPFELSLPEREMLEMDEFYALQDGLKIARHKIDKMVEMLESDDEDDQPQ